MQRKIHWGQLLLSIIIAEAIGMLSGLLSGDIRAIYQAYNTPPFSPPGWVFGVVWPVLYALMGVAAYFLYRDAETRDIRRGALIPYAAQLIINFAWSIVFFRLQFPWGGAILCLALIAALVWTMMRFARINRASMLLMIPYLLWITFATYLAFGVAILN